MLYYIGQTDYAWFNYLRQIQPEDVNFWRPGGKTNFKAIPAGSPFLLKLKQPYNAIAGVGFFSSHSSLPISVAWDAFGDRNGCANLDDLRKMINSYRSGAAEHNPIIGCTILTNPVFFNPEDWIPTPEDWAKSIVQGKTYNTQTIIGDRIWQQVNHLLGTYLTFNKADEGKSQLILENQPLYGNDILTKVRLGQGAFRILITDAYSRQCSISGERTLPVLEAAHIKPYALSGPHFISNGLLLRSDLHKLFDSGYITITKDYQIEVSKRIKEEFENGKEYYKFHGAGLKSLPNRDIDRPGPAFIEWHNSETYQG